MATPVRVVTLTVDELDRRMEQAAYKAVAKFVKDQEEQSKDDELLTTTELVELGKYGKSRETIKKFRDQIIAENPNQKIAIKHGRNWSYKLKAFDEWFVNHNEAHEEALKIDPRLRGDQMAYLSWRVLAIIACFLFGAIVNVIEGEKLNVLKTKYRKKHQEGETNDINKNS